MKRNLLVLIMALLLSSIAVGYAQPMQGAPGMGHGKGMGHGPAWMDDDDDDDFDGPGERWAEMLNLTEDQQKTIGAKHLVMQKKMMESHSEMQTLHIKLKLMMTEDKFNQSDADKLIDKISDMKKQQMKAHIAHMRAIRDLLTPEQRVKFDQIMLMKGGPGKGMMGQGTKGPRHPGMGRGFCQ